jgi:hypothetical protein
MRTSRVSASSFESSTRADLISTPLAVGPSLSFTFALRAQQLKNLAGTRGSQSNSHRLNAPQLQLSKKVITISMTPHRWPAHQCLENSRHLIKLAICPQVVSPGTSAPML